MTKYQTFTCLSVPSPRSVHVKPDGNPRFCLKIVSRAETKHEQHLGSCQFWDVVGTGKHHQNGPIRDTTVGNRVQYHTGPRKKSSILCTPQVCILGELIRMSSNDNSPRLVKSEANDFLNAA